MLSLIVITDLHLSVFSSMYEHSCQFKIVSKFSVYSGKPSGFIIEYYHKMEENNFFTNTTFVQDDDSFNTQTFLALKDLVPRKLVTEYDEDIIFKNSY